MARGLKPLELVQAAAIARRYYFEDKGKKEIGEEFGVSRYKVSRILDLARATGLVRIEIGGPATIDVQLSERMRHIYGLRSAVIVSTPGEPEELLRAHLGEVAADLLTEIVIPGDILGITWGRTLKAMTAELTSLARCTVVQMTGAVTGDITESSVEVARQLARVSGGRAYPIYSPMIVDTADAAASIRRQPHVADAIRMFDQLTKAVIAIGSWDPPNSELLVALDPPEREILHRAGVRAEVCTTFFDDDGGVVRSNLTDRAVSITAEQLLKIPEVVAVAGGQSKVMAIRAVLIAGFVTTLVTDADTARQLVESAPDPPRVARTRAEAGRITVE